MYYGRLYFWQEKALVRPVHLKPYEYYVDSGNWVDDFYDEIGDNLEGTDWHEEHYNDADYGGYYKTSKVQKEIICPDITLHLAEDFHHSKRNFFHLNNWSIPDALLWIDKLKKWW